MIPGALACDAQGCLWVADAERPCLMYADRAGRVQAQLRDDKLSPPLGICIAGDAAYVVDQRAGVYLWNTTELRTLAPPTATTTQATATPLGLAVDVEQHTAYVAIPTTNQIWRVTLDHGEVAPWAGTDAAGATDGEVTKATFAAPGGLALSPDRRRLYVTDSACCSIRCIDLRRNLVSTLCQSSAPEDQWMAITTTPAGLVVAARRRGALIGVNIRHATYTRIWPRPHMRPIGLPLGVAFDRTDKTLLTSDTARQRIVRIDRDAAKASEFALS